MKRSIVTALTLCLVVSAGRTFGEGFRGTVATSVTVPDAAAGDIRMVLGYLDIASINLEPDARFVQGVEIEFRIPKVVQDYPGSYAFFLYKNVRPTPESGTVSYTGDQVLMQVPQRISTIVQVPVTDTSTIKPSPYTVFVRTPVKPGEFPLALFVMPVMKGLPPEVEKAAFPVRVKPIYTDEGALKLSVSYPEGKENKPFSVFIDNHRVTGPIDDIVLKTGLHYLKLSSDDFRDEVRTFSIEPGKVVPLSVTLQDVTPLVLIEAPENARVTIDSEKVDFPAKTSFPVAAGDHVVVFRVGDYTISRTITLQKAKNYKISLNIQVEFQEN